LITFKNSKVNDAGVKKQRKKRVRSARKPRIIIDVSKVGKVQEPQVESAHQSQNSTLKSIKNGKVNLEATIFLLNF
jgi:hypothetical protein